jgi:hypothetical protein
MPTDSDYPVGYGRPPRQTRFRKGQSGNPVGRPRGAQNLATLIGKVLKEPVVVSENGRRKKITKREAMLKQLVNKAAAGEHRAIQLLLGEIRLIEARREASAPVAEAQLDEADRLVLRQIYARLQPDPPEGGGDDGSEP